MRPLPEWIGTRISGLMPVVDRLLNAPVVSFDNKLRSKLPPGPGIYTISRKDAVPGAYLRAGKTDKSLKQRIYQNHFMGDQAGNLRWQLVKDGACGSLDETKPWICGNCVVRFLVIEDGKERSLAEHFMLSVLQPKYADQGMRGSVDEM